MNKLFAVLAAFLTASTLQAQGIKSGTDWYDGSINYTATVQADGTVLMEAMDEGQEMEFVLVPVEGKSNAYTVAEGSNEGAINPFGPGQNVKFRHQDGLTVLCVYDGPTTLDNILVLTPDDSRFNNIWGWIPQIKGFYKTDPYGYEVEIKDDALVVEGSRGSYEVMTFNGLVIGVMKVEGTSLDGYWRLVPTLEGFKVYPGSFDEYGIFKTTDGPYSLVSSDRYTPRFKFASYLLLNKFILRNYKKSTLRIMRNSILARHGYRFQSSDLQTYFGSQDWYMPQNNDAIKLSFVEQLNIEMIKAAEAEPGHDDYVSE